MSCLSCDKKIPRIVFKTTAILTRQTTRQTHENVVLFVLFPRPEAALLPSLPRFFIRQDSDLTF